MEREVHVGEENVFVVHILNFFWTFSGVFTKFHVHSGPQRNWFGVDRQGNGVQVGLTLTRFRGQRRSKRCVRTDMKNITVLRGAKCHGDTGSRV